MAGKRFIIYCNRDKPHALAFGRELRDWLVGRAQLLADNLDHTLDLARLPAADFLLVLGGDGTILSTVRTLGENQLPIIGVNIGRLGFLAEFSIKQFQQNFERITNDGHLVSRRVLLCCRFSGPGRPQHQSIAVNELAVIAGPPFRMIEVSVAIGGEHLATTAGDGLIIATPTGSTAYNLSAGGPILEATLPAAVITPLAAHSLSFRPIVLTLDHPITINCRSYHPAKPAEEPGGMAVIDGQENLPLTSRDQIEITRATHQCQLVRNPCQSQWRLLNLKLGWGALPNYEK